MIEGKETQFYRHNGYLVVENVFSPEEVQEMRDALASLVADAKGKTESDSVHDLEPGHTAENPRVRRIKTPTTSHPVFDKMTRQANLVSILTKIVSPGIRLHGSKINIKAAHYGSPVEWHQDWAFYPHTNDDVTAVGVLLEDATEENGPLMVVPGSHKGPTFDHHQDGFFAGAIDPETEGLNVDKAVPLMGKAGACTFHHVRALHGSAQNRSDKDRPLLLYQVAATDAWDLMGVKESWEDYKASVLAGELCLEPRFVQTPVRLPLPIAKKQGSIYENQSVMKKRFFDFDPNAEAAE